MICYAQSKGVFQSKEVSTFLKLSKTTQMSDLFRKNDGLTYQDLIKRIGSDGGKQGNYGVYSLTRKGNALANKITNKLNLKGE